MIRTYKYRLYPTKAQIRQLEFLLLQARFVYNEALNQRITTYQETGESVSYPQQWTHFRDLRREQPDTLGQLNAASLQQLLRRLDKTFKAFFRRLKTGETPGFPRFKSPHRFHSLEYRHGDGCKWRIGERVMLYVQNVGEIKVRFHRDLPGDAKIKHAIIKRSGRKWYVCLMLAYPDPMVEAHPGPAVGIDMGLYHLLALSDNQKVENPRWLRQFQAKLRVAQHRVSRRKRGSQRRRKAFEQMNRLQARIANQRRDFWHKMTRKLVGTYGLIALEELTLKAMTANHHSALSARDVGLGEFQQLLAYKAEDAGTLVVTVNPAHNTSQVCSACGETVEKSLRARTHVCPHCGLELDRDVNAARNVLLLALEPARTERSELNVDPWVERALRSRQL
jgi:putative transposase